MGTTKTNALCKQNNRKSHALLASRRWRKQNGGDAGKVMCHGAGIIAGMIWGIAIGTLNPVAGYLVGSAIERGISAACDAR